MKLGGASPPCVISLWRNALRILGFRLPRLKKKKMKELWREGDVGTNTEIWAITFLLTQFTLPAKVKWRILHLWKPSLSVLIRGIKFSSWREDEVRVILMPKYLKPDLDKRNGIVSRGMCKANSFIGKHTFKKKNSISDLKIQQTYTVGPLYQGHTLRGLRDIKTSHLNTRKRCVPVHICRYHVLRVCPLA